MCIYIIYVYFYRKFRIADFTWKVLCVSVARIFVQDPYDSFSNINKLYSFADIVMRMWTLVSFCIFTFFHFYSFQFDLASTSSHTLISHQPHQWSLWSPSWNSGATSICPPVPEIYVSCSLYLILKSCAKIDIHLWLFTCKENH